MHIQSVNRRYRVWPLLLVAMMAYCATAHAWWDKEWTVRKKITLDTSSKGAEITDPIGTSVVLVRLHEGNFQFGAAQDDGGDMRFLSADDKTQLPFHIEKYDSLMNEAFVWVKVPDVKPGTPVSFWLYYGNPSEKAKRTDDGKGIYDENTSLIYHFIEHGTAASDSTGLGNNAQNAGIPSEGSMIGAGLRLSGHGPITIPTSATLDWAVGQSLTWSAWVKPTTLQPNAILFSRKDGSNGFVIGIDNVVPYVEVTDASGAHRSPGGTPMAVNAWKHLAVTADGTKVSLYLDGQQYGTLNAALPALNSPAIIDADSADGSSPNPGVAGEMDEMQISHVARPAGFIKLAAISQGSGENAGKLLVMDADEVRSGGWFNGGGIIGTLLKSVTIDGWLVIGVLAIMAVVSWYVMVTKFFYLQNLSKGTEEFLKEWRHVASDLTQMDHQDSENVKSFGGRVDKKRMKLLHQASIYQIYHIGSEEIGHRLGSGVKGLSARSIQAIRASLDGGMVRESQKLNDHMVYLTISIAGGPYLGLLGTVVGVMITFAEIAASGEVNINAIAPGIAAALIATVAGLLVAIPALFGYNYLISRIKDASSTVYIFIDEFVTKMAEFYPAE
ncbi:MAG: DUF2341 domain-containing protein [Chthoniobacterales bacterium]